MLKRVGKSSDGNTFWTLFVPEEACVKGLEVAVISTGNGLKIGDKMIPWADLAVAKNYALASVLDNTEESRDGNKMAV